MTAELKDLFDLMQLKYKEYKQVRDAFVDIMSKDIGKVVMVDLNQSEKAKEYLKLFNIKEDEKIS